MNGKLIRSYIETPIGQLTLLTADDDSVRLLEFTENRYRTESHILRHAQNMELMDGHPPRQISKSLKAYFEGEVEQLSKLDPVANGTDFQIKVWAALRRIPAGEIWSYAQLAEAVGSPKAFRAVGSANGANPISIIVPCHRVIASGGKLGGYGGGLDRKRWLLAHEASYCGRELALRTT